MLINDWFFPKGLKISLLPDSQNNVAADSSSLISLLNKIYKQSFLINSIACFLTTFIISSQFCTSLIFSGFGLSAGAGSGASPPIPPFHHILSFSSLSRMETLSFSTHTPSPVLLELRYFYLLDI